MRMNGSQVVVEECAEFSLSEYGASSNHQMRQILSTFLCLVRKLTEDFYQTLTFSLYYKMGRIQHLHL